MLRGRTRRLGTAALGVALTVALALAASATARAPAGKAPQAKAAGTIILGTKDFTEEYVLGELYKQALESKGFKVQYKPNIGATEIIFTALTSGKITMYPEYIGEIVQTAFHQTKLPPSARGWWALGKKLLEQKGFSLTQPTPFFDVDAIAVRKEDAQKYKLKSLFDLKKLQDSGKVEITLGARPEFKNREEGFLGMQKVYGLTKVKYVQIATGLTYQALDQKKVFSINVFSTDAQLAGGKYAVLTDPKNIFGFQNVAVILKKDLASDPKIVSTIDAVTAKLTTPAIIAMNSAVVFNKQTPKAVATKFLKANGLI